MTNSEDAWTPCHYIDYGEEMGGPRFGVLFDDFGDTQEFLEAQDFMGGGYTWHGIVEALMRMYHAEYVDAIDYDPEGSMFCARSSNLDALRCVAACIRKAKADPRVLEDAIQNADPSIIE
ncbi:MAG: Imm51 family immunity protein [Caldilineaceae bacterium]